MNIKKLIGITALFISLLFPSGLAAQDDSGKSDRLVVGTLNLPPYAMKSSDGRWEGLGMELWRATAEELGIDFVVREFEGIKAILDAVLKGEVDIIPVAGVSEDREIILDFSNHYHRSGLAIAVGAEKGGFGWLHFIDRMVSVQFLKIIGSLILLWLIAGMLVWLLESRHNHEMFGDSVVKGLGHGIWWAAVTMTTVGYGDKAPKSLGGRTIAIVWMFTSIIMISSFTAAITTSLTVSELSGKVHGSRDLPSVRVGTVALSKAQKYLVNKGIAGFPFKNERDGLKAVVDARIDAFVYDESVLKYLAKTQFQSRLQILPETFDHFYVSMALPPGSPLREELNRAILKFMQTNEWSRLNEKYFGSNS